MADTSIPPPPEITLSRPDDEAAAVSATVSNWTGSSSAGPHPEAAEIVRQFEYYFSDENLRGDRHLLGLAGGDGNGPVSIGEICGWRKMRRFKPKTAVIEALRQSEMLEVVNKKQIKRKYPLTKPPFVKPEIDEERDRKAKLLEQMPWLSKNMLKATGFEVESLGKPVDQKEYEEEHKLYPPGESFATRIETAINRFASKRKLHQNTAEIFQKFMRFGGISCGPQQFASRPNKKQLAREGLDKEDIELMTANYAVSDLVLSGLYEEEGKAPVWKVNFESTAKGFLSSHFMSFFAWYEMDKTKMATNILRNFYNFLLQYDVCPEYADQLKAAYEVCNQAESELMTLSIADRYLPGSFNEACSVLYGKKPVDGWYEDEAWPVDKLKRDGNGWEGADNEDEIHPSDALIIIKANMYAHASEEQLAKLECAKPAWYGAEVIWEEILGLEVVSIEPPNAEAKAIYADENFTNTYVKPMGTLKCVYWKAPMAAPLDVGASYMEKMQNKEYEFLIEESTLEYCPPGTKMEVEVKELEGGILWITRVEALYPTFFTWLANEVIMDYKKPGPPKEWMIRQMERDRLRDAGIDPDEQSQAEEDDEPDSDDEVD